MSTPAGTILIVDDNQGDADLLREAFKEADPGLEIQHVRNGRDVITTLRLTSVHAVPDAVILDYHMPGMSGVEVLEEIAKHPAWGRTPLILCTGLEDPDIAATCRKAGATLVRRKPMLWDEVVGFAKEISQLTKASARQPRA